MKKHFVWDCLHFTMQLQNIDMWLSRRRKVTRLRRRQNICSATMHLRICFLNCCNEMLCRRCRIIVAMWMLVSNPAFHCRMILMDFENGASSNLQLQNSGFLGLNDMYDAFIRNLVRRFMQILGNSFEVCIPYSTRKRCFLSSPVGGCLREAHPLFSRHISCNDPRCIKRSDANWKGQICSTVWRWSKV